MPDSEEGLAKLIDTSFMPGWYVYSQLNPETKAFIDHFGEIVGGFRQKYSDGVVICYAVYKNENPNLQTHIKLPYLI